MDQFSTILCNIKCLRPLIDCVVATFKFLPLRNFAKFLLSEKILYMSGPCLWCTGKICGSRLFSLLFGKTLLIAGTKYLVSVPQTERAKGGRGDGGGGGDYLNNGGVIGGFYPVKGGLQWGVTDTNVGGKENLGVRR